jgi:hypothetical protein
MIWYAFKVACFGKPEKWPYTIYRAGHLVPRGDGDRE